MELKRKTYNKNKLKNMLTHEFLQCLEKIFSGDALYKNRFGQIIDYKESVEKNIIS